MYTTEPTASERRPGGGREQNQNTEIHEKTQIHAAKKTENNIEINDIDHMRFKTTRPAELIHISVSWTLCLVLAACWSVFTSASAQTSFNRTRETDRLRHLRPSSALLQPNQEKYQPVVLLHRQEGEV